MREMICRDGERDVVETKRQENESGRQRLEKWFTETEMETKMREMVYRDGERDQKTIATSKVEKERQNKLQPQGRERTQEGQKKAQKRRSKPQVAQMVEYPELFGHF